MKNYNTIRRQDIQYVYMPVSTPLGHKLHGKHGKKKNEYY